MLRSALALTTLLCLAAGCSPCNAIANAEASADDKYKACGTGSSAWSNARVTQCNDNLKNCSSEDQKWMNSYADCLNKLPACDSGHGFSWSISRAECATSNLFHLSGACARGLSD